mmetsp:Transcript_31261/g.61915  ORF Transcript_31261/g.61915 Transcript_31261/m.61915 type:complete len:223 (-) Transcript_31261:656-1324(-)
MGPVCMCSLAVLFARHLYTSIFIFFGLHGLFDLGRLQQIPQRTDGAPADGVVHFVRHADEGGHRDPLFVFDQRDAAAGVFGETVEDGGGPPFEIRVLLPHEVAQAVDDADVDPQQCLILRQRRNIEESPQRDLPRLIAEEGIRRGGDEQVRNRLFGERGHAEQHGILRLVRQIRDGDDGVDLRLDVHHGVRDADELRDHAHPVHHRPAVDRVAAETAVANFQ